MKKKHFAFILSIISSSLVTFNLFALGSTYENFFLAINGDIFEPTLYFIIGVTVSSFILIFFSQILFEKWLRNIFSWFFPISVILIASGTTGSSYMWLPRTDIATMLGIILVVLTVIFVLLHRFYFNTK